MILTSAFDDCCSKATAECAGAQGLAASASDSYEYQKRVWVAKCFERHRFLKTAVVDLFIHPKRDHL